MLDASEHFDATGGQVYHHAETVGRAVSAATILMVVATYLLFQLLEKELADGKPWARVVEGEVQ